MLYYNIVKEFCGVDFMIAEFGAGIAILGGIFAAVVFVLVDKYKELKNGNSD